MEPTSRGVLILVSKIMLTFTLWKILYYKTLHVIKQNKTLHVIKTKDEDRLRKRVKLKAKKNLKIKHLS